MALITFLVLLTAVVAVSVVAQRTGWSKENIALLIGAILAFFHIEAISWVHITPEFVIEWLLPILIMPAAFKIAFSDLRRSFSYVALLATVGVVVAATVGTGLLSMAIGLPFAVAALPAIAMAATDPISVIALLKRVGAPHRLGLLFEMEALFNDATAAVAFRSAMAVAAGGLAAGGSAEILGDFAIATFGGIAAGLILGMAGSMLHRLLDAPDTEVLLTVWLAFAAIATELLHLSGVLAVVTTALVLGNVGRKTGMGPQTRMAVRTTWDVVEHAAVVLVFLLIGLELNPALLREHWQVGLMAIPISLLMRAVSVYLVTFIHNRFSRERIPMPYQHVLIWGGVRGAVSLALVIGLPASLPYASDIKVMVYMVVIFNILAQGMTVGVLLRGLGLSTTNRFHEAQEHLLLRRGVLLAQLAELDRVSAPGQIDQEARAALTGELEAISSELDGLWEEHPELKATSRQDLEERLATAGLDYLSLHHPSAEAGKRLSTKLYEKLVEK